jgi:hypothetical protein
VYEATSQGNILELTVEVVTSSGIDGIGYGGNKCQISDYGLYLIAID